MISISPYLMFNGNCEEAMNFYKDIFGGEFGYIGRFSEMPGDVPEEYRNRIMHIELKLEGASLLASDYGPGIAYMVEPEKAGIHISIFFDDVKKMESAYQRLSEGGHVTMALQDTFWGDRFAMLADKYGFKWMLSAKIPK